MWILKSLSCRSAGNARRQRGRTMWTCRIPTLPQQHRGATRSMMEAHHGMNSHLWASSQVLILRMLGLDILHIFHLGVGHDLLDSAIRVLARLRFWRGNNLDQHLASAPVSMRSFARQFRLPLRLKRLNKANLNWKSNEYPEIHCKGYDTFVLLKWLESEMDTGGAGRSSISSSNPGLGIQQCFWIAGKYWNVFDFESTRPSENCWQSSHAHVLGIGSCSARARRSPLENQAKMAPATPPFPGDGESFSLQTFTISAHPFRATERSINRWLLGLRPKLEAVLAECLEKTEERKPWSQSYLCFCFFFWSAVPKIQKQPGLKPRCFGVLTVYVDPHVIRIRFLSGWFFYTHTYVYIYIHINTCIYLNMYIYIYTYMYI